MSWEQVYQQWLNEENIPENLKNELKDLNTDPEKCEDAFYAPLEFGTAGMRGILGAGSNRMNLQFVKRQKGLHVLWIRKILKQNVAV